MTKMWYSGIADEMWLDRLSRGDSGGRWRSFLGSRSIFGESFPPPWSLAGFETLFGLDTTLCPVSDSKLMEPEAPMSAW